MNPIVVALGKVLRLVGISSPEDNVPKVKVAADPPSWRDAVPATAPVEPLPRVDGKG
jgi:hypothetical protein